MYRIREVFICKPGQASKMAKWMKDNMEGFTIMTDMTGVYNKVVAESEVESLAAWEAEMKKYADQSQEPKDEKAKKDHDDYLQMYTQGKREIFRIW